ncbi:MAG: DnaJ domain-containing protein [Desulfobacterales bacterium]|nr:DnaJ domain-containing protein [Desulfobacterales bacterium]
MNMFWVILIVVLGLIYIVWPYDLLPDIFPITGWIDDIGILAMIFYYMKTGRLPGFVSQIGRWLFGGKPGEQGKTGGRQSSGAGGSKSGRQDTGRKDPYTILGIEPGASKEEIHEAYRRLVQQYHPDKVSHLGDEFRELAQDKFVEIQWAYEELTGRSR